MSRVIAQRQIMRWEKSIIRVPFVYRTWKGLSTFNYEDRLSGFLFVIWSLELKQIEQTIFWGKLGPI